MKTSLLLVFFTLISLSITFAQNNEKLMKPIGFDSSTLSGLGLKKIDLKDEPEKDFYQKNLYWGKELGVFVVSTETWTNTIESYPFDEFIYMYQGEAIVKPFIGKSQIFYSGDYFFAPKGFKGDWEVKSLNHSHYELSIITTKRSDSTTIQTDAKHLLFDKATLSGSSIVFDESKYHEEVLEKGAELTVKLVGEDLVKRSIEKNTREQFIQILAGQITIVDQSGESSIYNSGDSFLLPIGLSGTWENKGHSLVKYLIVEKTRSK